MRLAALTDLMRRKGAILVTCGTRAEITMAAHAPTRAETRRSGGGVGPGIPLSHPDESNLHGWPLVSDIDVIEAVLSKKWDYLVREPFR